MLRVLLCLALGLPLGLLPAVGAEPRYWRDYASAAFYEGWSVDVGAKAQTTVGTASSL